MSRTPTRPWRKSSTRRAFHLADEDPLASVANLFDVAIGLIAGLILAMVASNVPAQLPADATVDVKRAPAERSVDVPTGRKPLDRLSASSRTLKGEGARLGSAYRLRDGSIVYVPEE